MMFGLRVSQQWQSERILEIVVALPIIGYGFTVLSRHRSIADVDEVARKDQEEGVCGVRENHLHQTVRHYLILHTQVWVYKFILAGAIEVVHERRIIPGRKRANQECA
jgi:hypothetical protein